jgi:minor extracellular protease Epr
MAGSPVGQAGKDAVFGYGLIQSSFAGQANVVVALRGAMARHVVVVAAAGNDGPAAPPPFPAAEPGVIAVTAVDSHSRPYADGNRGDYVQFAAPGVRVWTPGPTTTGSYHTVPRSPHLS